MIIIQKHYVGGSYNNLALALCEELRRTDKRVYVKPIAQGGYTYGGVVSGRAPDQYVEINQVLSWDADEAMFQRMLDFLKESELEEARLRRALRESFDARDRKLYAIAQRIESPAIQEDT